MTAFHFRMAWRETRAAWRHFLYFFFCIALGVGALVGVALFAASLEEAVSREARTLMGGDLEIRTSRPMGESGQSVLQSLADRGVEMMHASQLVGMAAAADASAERRTQIIELKAVEPNYPLFGELVLEPPGNVAERLAADHEVCGRRELQSGRTSRSRADGARTQQCFGALVQESLLIRMGLSLGEHLRIGEATFAITGLIRKEPDRVANAFSLGPRVMISRAGLDAAALVKPGSRVRERYLLRLPETIQPTPLMYELRGRLAAESARISTFRNAQPRLRRFLDQLSRYLGLIGLAALFIGGIGVATTVQAFIREKLKTIAILKTLGAESATVVRTYLTQAFLLGLIGSAAGVALGFGLQTILPSLLKGFVASDLLDRLSVTHLVGLPAFLVVLKGVALGLLTTLLFTLWPLLAVRDIRPALIFRREVAPTAAGQSVADREGHRSWAESLRLTDPVRVASAVVIAAGLAALGIWQAGSWTVGLVFMCALTAAVVLLWAGAVLLVRVLARLPGVKSITVRHAVRNLRRPGSQAAGVMAAIGIGVMVIVGVSLIEQSLLRQIGESRPADAPTFFFIDIQPDQKEGFVRLLEDWGRDTGLENTDAKGADPEVTPLVRSRLYALDGERVVTDKEIDRATTKRATRKRWYFTREYVLTFLQELPKDNVVVKGAWWDARVPPETPLLSIEEEAARNLGVDIGSVIEFDIQGATIAVEVASIRKVDWGNLSTNFFMILSPGALEGAPFTYVATVRVSAEEEVPLQQAVVAAFPNVTAINVGEVLESFARILDRLSLAIRSVAILCILAGALVMAAALAATRYRRLYESVVLKALGATRGLVARAFAAEYALLGAVAGLIGVLLASALSWGILYFFLDVPWTFQPEILAWGFLLTVLLALGVGFLSTFRILGQRPLRVLRQE